MVANEPVTKHYANRVYVTHGGFTMQDNIGMDNHEVLGLNHTPSDGVLPCRRIIQNLGMSLKMQTSI